MRRLATEATTSLAATGIAAVLLVPALAHADASVTSVDGQPWSSVVATLQSDPDSEGRAIWLCAREDDASPCARCGEYALSFDEAGSRAFVVRACDQATGATEVQLVDRSALFDGPATSPRVLTVAVLTLRGLVSSEPPERSHGGSIITIAGPGFGHIGATRGRAGGTMDGTDPRRGCAGHFPPVAQHVIRLNGAIPALAIRAVGRGHELNIGVRTADGEWHCNDDGIEWPHPRDPVVRLVRPAVGRVDVWVGTYDGETDVAYSLEIDELSTAYSRRPDPTLLVSGVLMQTLCWAMLAALAAVPAVACDGADCPNDTWRQLAWIPLVGPWLGEIVDGSRGNSYSLPALADAALQDVGLILALVAVLFRHEREVPTASLGVGRDAARLTFAGDGGRVGLRITF